MLKFLKRKRKEIAFCLFLVLFFIILNTLQKTVKISTSKIYISAGYDTKFRDDFNRPSVPKTLTNCTSRSPTLKFETRGNFTIVTNFVVAKRHVNCRQFVTYTTHGDFRYLDNLVPLVERWLAPISVALYTPSSELLPTLNRIAYLRECTTPLIKTWVTFHLFSETMEFTDPTPFLTHLIKSSKKFGICEDPLKFTGSLKLVRRKGNRLYPINVARNVARLAATTHFVLPSDIELFPSLNFNRKFIGLLIREELMFKSRQVSYVFVLPVFEINNVTKLPDTKRELMSLINEGLAASFHAKSCDICHRIPNYKPWVSNDGNDSLNVFHVAKRSFPFHYWEPFYVGTNQDPLFDERLSWEGLGDKMSQAYALCVLDYDFMILDNSFLVHRNGIEHSTKPAFQPHDQKWKDRNNRAMTDFQNELERVYGNRTHCGPQQIPNIANSPAVSNKSAGAKILDKQRSSTPSLHKLSAENTSVGVIAIDNNRTPQPAKSNSILPTTDGWIIVFLICSTFSE